ncbi:MAG: glycosyltransferase [Candidatus Buchananbacteria bacterium]
MKIIIAVPAYNEEAILEASINKLVDFCQKNLTIDYQIIIADNNSTDQTAVLAKNLAEKFNVVKYLFVDKKGKGIAIQTAWLAQAADLYCFMDADLATDLQALPLAINEIKAGSDMVIGSRFHPQSQVDRLAIRKFTSHCYRLVLKIILGLKINDAPCGFKVITEKVKTKILPQIKNQEWFFDSELAILAEKNGFKIKEIPVVWRDPREGQDKSRVNVLALGLAYFSQVINLKKRIKSLK